MKNALLWSMQRLSMHLIITYFNQKAAKTYTALKWAMLEHAFNYYSI